MRRSRRPQGRPDAPRAIGRPATQALMQACVRARAAGRTASAAMATNELNDLQEGILVPSYGIVLKPGHGTSHPDANALPSGRSLGACTPGSHEQLSSAASGDNRNVAVAIRRSAMGAARPCAGSPNRECVRGTRACISQSDRFAAFRINQQWTS